MKWSYNCFVVVVAVAVVAVDDDCAERRKAIEMIVNWIQNYSAVVDWQH